MPSRNSIPALTIRADENSVYYTPVENYLEHFYECTANSTVYANSAEDYINKIVEKYLSTRLEEEVEKCVKKIYNKKKIDNE